MGFKINQLNIFCLVIELILQKHALGKKLMLVIVATPIGNVEDMSVRATNYLREADILACEDTRTTMKLLRLLNVKFKGKILAYHDYNGASVRPFLLSELQQGKIVALVSDAGTPLISDPGFKLVEACHENKIKVTATPGPTAPIMALTISGLPTDKFTFNGFVPASAAASRKSILETANSLLTQIWFSTAAKLVSHLRTMLSIYGNRHAVVARELTKLHEEVRRGTLEELLLHYQNAGSPKGEIVLIVSGGPDEAIQQNAVKIDSLLKEALKRLSLRDAVNEVSILTGMSKKLVYQHALTIVNKEPKI